MKKETIMMLVAVHPVKAKLWRLGTAGLIDSTYSLRKIGKMINVNSPQIIKHHLENMVKMGAIDFVEGQYRFPFIEQPPLKQ